MGPRRASLCDTLRRSKCALDKVIRSYLTNSPLAIRQCPFWSSEESLAGLHAGCRSEAALQAKADSPEVLAEVHASGAYIDAQDAVDFVHQCLHVHAKDRPPAVQLRKHRFISGKVGWVGTRGWESLEGYSSAASGFDSA